MGLAPWEYTIAELLSDGGYATALYGKWHVGNVPGRMPTDQGFDEWWGILNSSDEAGYSRYPLFKATGLPAPQVWEGRKGAPSKPVGEFVLETKRLMDESITERTVDYIRRQASQNEKPFLVYVGLTQVHPPMVAHPDFAFKSPQRGGVYADIIGEMDFRVGQILDAITAAGIEDNTIVVLSSDNGACRVAEGGGSSGPWRGHFFTPPFEGSYRVPAMVRWPGKIPAGVVTGEMLHAADWLPTLAGLVGESSRVPSDRPIDGVDASALLIGKSAGSGRDAVMLFGPDGKLMSVKWHTVKVILRYAEGIDQPIVEPYMPLMFDLSSDPQETVNLWELNMDMGWMLAPVAKVIDEYQTSVAQFPNIEPGQEFAGYE